MLVLDVNNYLGCRGYPKSNPIKFNDLNFYKEDRLICIEGLIWNYQSILKFLDLFNNIKKKIYCSTNRCII